MPETCWEFVKNKHLTVASCWFSLSLHNLCTACLGPIKPAIRWAKCFFPEDKAARARSWPLTPHPVPKFVMSGVTPLLPLYGFMAWAGATWLSLNARLLSYTGVRRWGSIIMKTFCVYGCCVFMWLEKTAQIYSDRINQASPLKTSVRVVSPSCMTVSVHKIQSFFQALSWSLWTTVVSYGYKCSSILAFRSEWCRYARLHCKSNPWIPRRCLYWALTSSTLLPLPRVFWAFSCCLK